MSTVWLLFRNIKENPTVNEIKLRGFQKAFFLTFILYPSFLMLIQNSQIPQFS